MREYRSKLNCESSPSLGVFRIRESYGKVRLGPVIILFLFLLAGLGAQDALAQAVKGRTRNPHGALPIACENCHTATSWSPVRPHPDFNHNETRFPLRGMHSGVSCRLCHKNLVFKEAGIRCADCHADIHRRQFGGECEKCHTVRGWDVTLQTIKGHQNRFPLMGAHASTDCQSCHKGEAVGQFTGLSTACMTCHLPDYNAAKAPNHVASNFPVACDTCHAFDSWLNAKFDHSLSKFPLTGAHMSLQCGQCHKNGRLSGLTSACASCHLADYVNTREPVHQAAGFPQDCSLCHSTAGWQGATFSHKNTPFPLTGAHINVAACAQCHKNNVYAGLSMACVSCHLPDFNGTTNPNHPAAGFPQDCSLCHSTTNWLGATFNHSTATKFPLTGAHINVAACAQCHKNSVFAGLPSACVSCHLPDFNGATNPNHVTAGFSQNCGVCHTTTTWQGGTFNHANSPFPLTGAHSNVACAQCHKNNVYAGLSTACISCHLADFNGTTGPNHPAAGFPQDCRLCHSTTNWLGATFNHSTATKFPLTGTHITASCAQCHKNNVFAGLSTACITCHLADFNGTTSPNHPAAGFPQDCSLCHSTTNWLGATFNHSTATKFPLTGAHNTASCAQCHKNNVYAGLPTACVSCHLADFNGTTSPNHVAAGFPQDCSRCHSTTNWQGATFNHASTPFPLTGAHVSVTCAQCHKNSVYAGLPTACVSCHLTDFNGTTSPNHAAAGFPQDCSLCHSTTNWQGATFNHTNTPFPLTGAHVSVTCAQCHKNNVYAGLPTACVSCHLTNFNGTTNPNHVAAGFPQDCSLCHSTTNWQGATFNHASTPFPLTGAHVNVLCANCHIGNIFAGTPIDCYSCHSAVYKSTTSPNHVAAGFPTTCQTCHTTASWSGAAFNHTWFPNTHGRAAGVCSTCHTNSSNYSIFVCTSCHTQAQVDPRHSGVRGYVYNSANCYQCHPRGNAG
jgi:hypothetical protein